MNTLRMTADEIKSYLTTNMDNRKRVMLHNIGDILAVNALLTDEHIACLRHDSAFYDALHAYDVPFVDVLDMYYMTDLDIAQNSNDVMCWLHAIYT